MWGICFFDQIFNQMPHCWAINIGQIPYHFAINCNKYYINKSHIGSNCPNLGPNQRRIFIFSFGGVDKYLGGGGGCCSLLWPGRPRKKFDKICFLGLHGEI